MPSITRDPKTKSWFVRWREGGRGSKNQSSPALKTKNDAQIYAQQLDARLAAAKRITDPCRPIPLTELAERHLNTRPSNTDNLTARCRYDNHDRAAFQRLFALRPKWHTARDIDFDNYQTLTVTYRRYAKILIRLAAALGQPHDNTILLRRLPNKRRTPRAPLLTDQQISAAQHTADQWGPGPGLAVHLIRLYGHRPETIANLTQQNYNPTNQTITLAIKGGDTHQHPITPQTADRITNTQTWLKTALKRPLNNTDPLVPCHYPTPDRKWPQGQSLGWWYHKAIGKNHHPQHPGIYQLKRAAISNMLTAGLDPKTIASITGHRTPSVILNTYATTNLDRQRTALKALTQIEPQNHPNPTP